MIRSQPHRLFSVVKPYAIVLALMLSSCSEHSSSDTWLHGVWVYDTEQTERCFAEYSVDVPPQANKIMLSTQLVITEDTFDSLDYVVKPAPEGFVRIEFNHPTHPGYHVRINGDGICLHTISFGDDFETICMVCFERGGET